MRKTYKLFATSIMALGLLMGITNVQAQQNKYLFDAALQNAKEKNAWQQSDISDYAVTDQYTDKETGITHAYIQQRYHGIPVFNAISVFAIKDNKVAYFKEGLIPDLAKQINTDKPAITAEAAIAYSLINVGGTELAPVKLVSEDKTTNTFTFKSAALSRSPIKVQLMYRAMEKTVLLTWNVSIEMINEPHWWNIRIDALTGGYIDKNDYVTNCSFEEYSHKHLAHDADAQLLLMTPPSPTPSPVVVAQYNVFPFPVEAPSFGTQTLLIDPADYTSSPYGWHDVDGAAGAEYTITRGNNVYAYEDANADNIPGYSPDGGAALNFNFAFNAANAPLGNQDASITNLFYGNNRIHDILYHSGFTEAAGNFQQNNYGNGGVGNDPVLGEAFDGSGTNNANFATPPDGASGRMQMFLWTAPNPDRDGSFDNGIVIHEFGHGLSNRLTGGPANSSCLFNAEQGGEGWSDWLALMMSTEPGDTTAGGMLTQARGIGTYALNQAVTGLGIRRFRYSVNMAINPQTYADVATSGTSPHQKGEIWCDAIWDMSCFLINDLGFSSDPAVATAGNNIAMRLVLEGMKLQPCGPGFLDARNAILLADHILYNDAHCTRIWQAFARRGMGINAVQGSANSSTDQVADFTPYSCAPCTGTPEAGSAAANEVSVCTGSAFTVSMTGQSSGVGVNNQWQSSPDNLNWTNIATAVSASYTGSQNAATYYRCLVTCATSGIADSTNSVLIGQIANCIIISNHTDTTCNAAFYDTGGSGNDYNDNENFVQTFVPATVGGRSKIVWNSFASESNFDFITIYDGPNTSSPILYGPLSGILSIPTFISSDITGALTVKFTSDVSITAAGWSALVICDLPCNGPVIQGQDTVDVCNGSSTTLTITGGASGYTWSPATGLNQTTGLSVIASPTVSTTYTVASNDDPSCKTMFRVNVIVTPDAPTTGNYALCQGGTIPGGQGLTASAYISGNYTTENKFSGSPYSSVGPVTTVGSISLPALPAGSVITSAELKLYNVISLGASWRSEVRVALSGAYTKSATQVSTLASAGNISPDPVVNLSGFPITGGTVNLVLSESFDDVGITDATIDSARIDITYTVPVTTISWWDAASSGTQLGTGSPFDPIGTVALPNSNIPNSYTFYAQNNLGVCGSSRVPAVLTINPAPVPVITGNTTICPGSSTTLDAGAGFASYLWSTSETTQTISVIAGNTYIVTVTNALGCAGSSQLVVTVAQTDDSNACTTDACDPSTGIVTHTPINADDNNACTLDGCDPVTGVYHTPASCNDNNVCTTDVCDPINGCIYTSVNTDDNNACTADGCDPSTGVFHNPLNTDDSNACTTDGCDPVTGIYHNPVSTTIAVGSISGYYLTQCVQLSNYMGLTYSVPAISGATFNWTLPVGMFLASGQGTNSIIINLSLTAIHNGIIGQICVNAQTACASGSTCANIEIEAVKPVSPGSVSGPVKICPGDVVTYSVTPVSRATYYQWNLPAFMSGSSTSNSITVTVLPGFSGGSISVQAGNVCGLGTARSKTVSFNVPNTPSLITGPIDGVCEMTGVIYSITGAVGATYYQWLAPGVSSLSGQGTTSIMVDFPVGYTSGTISVVGINACTLGAARTITVRSKPATPDLIAGTSTACANTPTHYVVNTVAGTTSYNWTGPVGSSISGQGSKAVDITFTVPGSNKTIGVTTTNSCGTSAKRSKGNILVTTCPRMSDQLQDDAIMVYPNPAHELLTIKLNTSELADVVITMKDILGRTVITQQNTAVEGVNVYDLHLAAFAKGIYLLQVQNGEKTETIKVVVE